MQGIDFMVAPLKVHTSSYHGWFRNEIVIHMSL